MTTLYARTLHPIFARAALYQANALRRRIDRMADARDRLSLASARRVRIDTEAAMRQPIGARGVALDALMSAWDRRSAVTSELFNSLDDLRRAWRFLRPRSARYSTHPTWHKRIIVARTIRRPYRAG